MNNSDEEYTLWHALTCSGGNWLPTNHLLFHLANICLFFTYTTPPGFAGIVFLRVVLVLACFFFTVWGWFVLCALDTLLWNFLFTIINLLHLIVLIVLMKPLPIPDDVKEMLERILGPYKVSPQQFFKLYKQSSKAIIRLRQNEIYAVEETTRADRLSLILSGKVMLTHQEHCCDMPYVLEAGHFIESREWFNSEKSYFYSMSVTALEVTYILVWERSELQQALLLGKDEHLKAALDAAIAMDYITLSRIPSSETVDESQSFIVSLPQLKEH